MLWLPREELRRGLALPLGQAYHPGLTVWHRVCGLQVCHFPRGDDVPGVPTVRSQLWRGHLVWVQVPSQGRRGTGQAVSRVCNSRQSGLTGNEGVGCYRRAVGQGGPLCAWARPPEKRGE